MLSLHRNLQEIQTSLDGRGESREHELLQSAIDRAEQALRAQAHALVSAARGSHQMLTSNSLAASLGADYREPRRSTPPPAPPPPQFPRAPAAPSHGGRAASVGLPRRPVRAPTGGRQMSAKTTGRRRLLPKINRADPLADPPALTEFDLQAGLLDLASRGFIPPAADLTPAMERGMPCLMQKPALVYDQALKQERYDLRAEELAKVRVDLREHVLRTLGPPEEPPSLEPSQVRTSRQLPPLPALPAPPPAPGSVAEAYGTFCTELLDAAGEPDATIMEAAVAALPPGPTQAEIQAAAVSKIAAAWRMADQRGRYLELRTAHRAARRIQSGWQTSVVRSATRQELMRREEEERKLQTMMVYQIGQDWFQAKAMRRVEVHVCSLTIAEHRRRRMDGYQVLQAAQIARIFRLADSKRDIIFVAPKHVHEDVLDYYSKIMQFRGIQNPPGRFQVVVPENIGLKDKMSLTQALLCSPKALKRIRKLVSNRLAMLIPEAVTHVEAKLSCTLRLPLIGPSARNMSLLASKSNAKKLTQLAGLPTGPWAVDIYDEDEFFTCLAGLVVKHPKVKTWLFKIDDERGSRGTAYIDLSKLHQVQQSVHASAPALLQGPDGTSLAGGEDEEPAVIGADANEVRASLQYHVPRKAVLCHRQVYGDFANWLAEACRIGCVIQAVPESMISQTSVHFQVAPDGAIDVLGTSEAVMSTPFVRAASWYPHTRGSFEVLQEVGYRLGRSLAAKGFMGFASADIVFFDNPDFDASELVSEPRETTPAIIGSDTPINPEDLMFGDLRSPSPDVSVDNGNYRPSVDSLPESRQADYTAALEIHQEHMRREQQAFDPVSLMLGVFDQGATPVVSPFACWVVDVDARLTDEAAMIFPLKFIAQVKQDPAHGFMTLTPEAQDVAGQGQDLTEEDKALRSQRWALVNSVAMAPQLERMSHQVLFQAAKMRGVSFDLFHNVGCVFTFLDVVHMLFSLMVVDKTPEQCAKKMAGALAAIAEGPKGAPGAKPSAKQKVGGLPPEATDLLTLLDVQMAIRVCLKRFADKK